MSQIEINNSAKSELENIINELFLSKLELKLNENVICFDKKTDSDRRAITRNINDFKEEFQNKSKELPNLIKNVSSEIKTQSDQVKQLTNDGIESIQKKLSEIQNESLTEILSNSTNIIENQKMYSEDFLLKLDVVINSHTRNILSNNSENREFVKNSQAKFKSDFVDLINGIGGDQNKNFQGLGKSLSDIMELENQNNLNLEKQLDAKFQSIEHLNSVLIRDFDEKFKVLKTENEKQVSIVINKSNTALKILIISNILILTLLLLNYFSILE